MGHFALNYSILIEILKGEVFKSYYQHLLPYKGISRSLLIQEFAKRTGFLPKRNTPSLQHSSILRNNKFNKYIFSSCKHFIDVLFLKQHQFLEIRTRLCYFFLPNYCML